jgi:hypothetical protein
MGSILPIKAFPAKPSLALAESGFAVGGQSLLALGNLTFSHQCQSLFDKAKEQGIFPALS